MVWVIFVIIDGFFIVSKFIVFTIIALQVDVHTQGEAAAGSEHATVYAL